jgi:zinc-ribbon domain
VSGNVRLTIFKVWYSDDFEFDSDFMEVVIVTWVIFGLLSAALASNKGQNSFSGFLVRLFLGPLELLAVILQPVNQKALENRSLRAGTTKKCPYCAEIVKIEAKKCRHCGMDVMQ